MQPLETCVMKYRLQGDIKMGLEHEREWYSSTYFSFFVKIPCAGILNGSD